MKRIIAAIAVLLSVMCFAYAYRLQVLGMIQTDVVAVSDRNLAKTLQKGADGDKEPDPVTLEKFRTGDTVYRRGNNLYLGPKKERIQGEYPFYTGDGTGIWYFQATGSLMTDDFMEYEPYAGLFVSDGTAFDDEGVGQDEDTYIFAKLNNGLYMNTVPITIRSNGLDHALRLGSLICFREDDLSAYGYAGERLVYSDLKNLGSAKVVIRDNTYDYHSFVRLIGAVHDPSESAARDEKPEETMAAEEGIRSEADRHTGSGQSEGDGAEEMETEDGDDSSKDGSGTDGSGFEDTDELLENTPEEENDSDTGFSSEELDAEGANQPNEGDSFQGNGESVSLPNAGGGSGDGSGSSGSGNTQGSGSSNGSSESNSGDHSGSENGGSSDFDHGGTQGGTGAGGGSSAGGGNNNSTSGGGGTGDDMGTGGGDHGDSESGGSTNGGHGSSGNTTEGGGTSDGNGSSHGNVRKPVVSFTNAKADVYNVYGDLEIQDPDMRLKRVVLRVYEEENGQEKKLITRKNFKARGSIKIPNVRPDTSILVQGTFVWLNKDGVKETEEFMEDIPLHTLSLNHLAPYTFSKEQAVDFYADKIKIPNMQMTSSLPSDMLYIARGSVTVLKDGKAVTDEPLALAGTDIRSLRMGQKTTWNSDAVLKSGTNYTWELKLTDRFGNELPCTNPEEQKGSAWTSYRAPTASVSLITNAVGKQQMRISIVNEDKQYINLRDGYIVLCDPQTGAELSMFEQVGDDPATKIRRKVDLSQDMLTEILGDLPSGRNFRMEIHGTYDLKDTEPATATENALIGQTTFYTASISNLGKAAYELTVPEDSITASSATARFHLTSNTNEQLIQLMSRIKVVLSNTETGSREVELNRSEWMNKKIAQLNRDGEAYVLTDAVPEVGIPQVVLHYLGNDPEGTSVWDAICAYATVEVRYPKGKFKSKTKYDVSIQTTVTQASDEYDVSAAVTKAGFQTLKNSPQIQCGELLVISDFAELYNFRIDDPDGTVTDGRINMRLYAGERLVDSRIIETNRTYSADNTSDEDLMIFRNLTNNMSYTIGFYASEYNEYFDDSWKEENYELPKENWLKFTTGAGISGKVELRDLSEPENNAQTAAIRVIFKDPESDLLKSFTGDEKPEYLLEYRKVQGLDVSDAELAEAEPVTEHHELAVTDGSIEQVDQVFNYSVDLFTTYEIRLLVEVKGHKVQLGRVKFETGEKIYTISKTDDLKLLNQHKDGKFIVLNDITSTGTGASTGSDTEPFNGHLDFQGYTLTWNTTGSSRLFNCLGGRGIVENLELKYTGVASGRSGVSGLVYDNYGTVRNIITHVEFKGRFPIYYGGIVYNNRQSGVIENFAVELPANGQYVGIGSGGVTRGNEGIVRNGYVYGGSLITGSGVYGGEMGSRSSNGCITGSNSGTVYNCFTLSQVQIEEGTSMNTVGLAVGYNSGRVRNVLSVGDIYKYGFEDYKQTDLEPFTLYGGTVGYGAGIVQDTYILSERDETYGKDGNAVYKTAEPIETRTLRSASWHEKCFNSEGAFEVENMIKAGYYPRLNLPDSLKSKQDLIGLPLVGISSYPDIISSEVTETGTDDQGRDYALVNLEFYNPNGYEITGLDVKGLTAEIQEGQGATETSYKVTVKLMEPTIFRSAYTVTRVYYRGAGSLTINQYDYTNRSILASFFKPISKLSEWKTIKDDLAGNYRLKNDIDFSGSYSDDVRIRGTFTGTLDGDGHTLKNLQEIQYGSVFETISKGTIENLTVEGLKLSSNHQSATLRTGFAGTMKDSASMDHVFVVGTAGYDTVDVYGYGGVLAGEMNNVSITNCGVRDMELVSQEIQKNTLYLGGLAGSLSSTNVANSYVQGTTITADAGYTAAGIGGLAGVQGSGSPIENVYVQGSIHTSFQNAGGIAGTSGSPIKKVWSYVDINSISDNLGGIVGKLTAQVSLESLVSLGNIYTTSSNTGASGAVQRIVGTSGIYRYTTRRTVGYSGQLLGKEAPAAELRDVNRLSSLAELWTKVPYRDYAVLGASFDLNGRQSGEACTAENGVLPMLLDTEGALLAYQEPVSLPDPSLALKAEGMKDETTGIYSVRLTVDGAYDVPNQKTLYEVTKAEAPGLVLLPEAESAPKDEFNPDGSLIRIYEKIGIESYLDSYQVTVTLQKAEGGAKQVLTAPLSFGSTPLYHDIANAQQFKDVMTKYGQNYENFRITGEIDLNQVSDVPLNLKINRLVGAGSGHTISNLSYQIQSQGQSLFQVLTGTMENLTFKDMTVTSASSSTVSGGENVGLISINQGEIRNTSFENIAITAPSRSQKTGLIGTNMGTVKNVNLKDIRITVTSSYAGGLCGFAASGRIEDITATGTLDKNGNYQYRIAGGEGNSGGPSHIGGLIGRLEGEAEHLSADGIQVIGTTYVGGLIGITKDPAGSLTYYGYRLGRRTVESDKDLDYRGARTGTNKDAVGSEIIRNRIKGYQYVGGLFGYQGQSTENIIYCEIYNSDIECNYESAGPYAGGGSWNYPKYLISEDNKVSSMMNCAGGVSGEVGDGYNMLINHVTVSGSDYIGGVYGKYPNTNTNSALVENSSISGSSYVGGYSGYQNPNYTSRFTNIGVYNTEIKATGNYAGGLFGMVRPHSIQKCFVSKVDVSANAYAGGLVGDLYCGDIFGNIINANVTATLGAGGVSGRMFSLGYFASAPSSYPDTRVKRTIVTGTVSASSDRAGGLTGEFVRGDDRYSADGVLITEAPEEMTPDRFKANLLALTSVSSGSTSVGWMDFNTSTGLADAGQMDSSYIWDGMKLIRNSAESLAGNAFKDTELQTKTGLALTTSAKMALSGSNNESPYHNITSPDMSYWSEEDLEKGIMPYSKATDGLEILKSETESIEEKGTLSMKAIGAGIPIPQGGVTTLAMTEGELPGLEVYASGAGSINLEFDRDVTKDAEAGIGMRPVVDEEDASADDSSSEAQKPAAGTENGDTLYDMDADFAYGDTEAAVPEYRVRILSGQDVLADEAITGRVMTFSYDYQTPLTAEVTDGVKSEEYEIDPDELAHSVMVNGDSWYYLTAGGAGTPEGVKAGEYIHLFNGCALDLDGNIIDLESGSIIGTAGSNGEKLDTVPLYDWDYAGYELQVYKNFTLSAEPMALSEEDSEEASVLPYQAIVKNGELSLYNAQNPVSPDGWIIDHYQDESFMTVLGEDGKLADIGKDEIKLPDGFQNASIGEISNTAYADAPIVVGRYNSGKVFAFNYLTGENLEVVQNDEDVVNLVDFAKQWISDKTDSMFKSARSSYLAATDLGNKVDLNEVKNLYDGTNGTGTQNSIAGVLRGNTAGGAGGDPGQSDSGVRSNEQKEAGDGNGTAGGTTAANTVQTGEAGDGGDKTGSETGAKKNGVQSSKNDGADLDDSEDADEAEDAEDADEESSKSKKSSKSSSVKKARSIRAKSNASDSENESPESESLKKETSKSDSRTRSDSEKDSQAAVQSGEGAKAALDGTQTDVEKSADRKTGTGPAGDTAAEREKAGTGGRSGQAGEAGNGAEPSGSEAGAAGQGGTEAGAAGSTGAGQSGTEAGAAGQAGAEAGAAGDAASGQTGISGQSGTEAGEAGQAGADANAAGSAASGQTGTKLGTDKVAAAISSHDAERTKEALNSSWLPVYDAASGEYKLYNAGELLSSNGGVVLSAEEKMEALSRQGINVNYGQVNAGAHHTDSDKRGFKILGGIAAAILLILGSFWLRRRNAK